jgi:Uma2 family endonuclease
MMAARIEFGRQTPETAMSTAELEELEVEESILEEDPDESAYLGPESNGLTMTNEEFREIEDWDGNYRYELIRGVVVVSPPASASERGPNDALAYQLLTYQLQHPQGVKLDATLPEQEIDVGDSIRRADRVIWAGLGRQPDLRVDPPTIVIEFVSPGRAAWRRDYRDKRREYAALGVQEYWIIDRFRKTLSVCRGLDKPLIVKEAETYTTLLLPGFELKVGELLKVADRWK